MIQNFLPFSRNDVYERNELLGLSVIWINFNGFLHFTRVTRAADQDQLAIKTHNDEGRRVGSIILWYGMEGRGRSSPDTSRQTARAGDDMLCQEFLRAASHLLVTGGVLVIVNIPASLPWILLGCIAWDLTPLELQPVGPPGLPSKRILLRAEKGSGGDLVIKHQLTALELINRSKD